MAEDPSNPDGRINTERRSYLLLIGIDRPHKYNGFTPKVGQELGDAYTLLERDDDLRCGVLHAVGPHTTAGLDMPAMAPHRAKGGPIYGEGKIDCFGLKGPASQQTHGGRRSGHHLYHRHRADAGLRHCHRGR